MTDDEMFRLGFDMILHQVMRDLSMMGQLFIFDEDLILQMVS